MSTSPQTESSHDRQDLGGGLVMRRLHGEHDAVQAIALSAGVINDQEGAYFERVLRHRPGVRDGDFVVVEDTRSGRIAATTALMPWRCRLDGVDLDVAMLEMVVTHPDYRRRGLVRAQIERFHRQVGDRRFDLSIIQGIPHYYRQFGYTYALDHTACDLLPVWRVPQGSPVDAYALRPAGAADTSALEALYQRAAARHALAVQRTAGDWAYLLDWADYTTRLLVDTRAGGAVGYACTAAGAHGLTVRESALPDHAAALALLRLLQPEAQSELTLCGSSANTLNQAARSLGARPQPVYQWLVRIADVPAFLRKLQPAFERRLAASDCAGLTASLTVNLFRQACVLRFDAGRLVDVVDAGFVDASLGADGGDLCIPPDAFARLVTGYRTLDELDDAWPDTLVKDASRHIVDILFPRLVSWIHMPY